MTDVRELCRTCAMTREQRMGYPGGCPMNAPEVGCPFYDSPIQTPGQNHSSKETP